MIETSLQNNSSINKSEKNLNNNKKVKKGFNFYTFVLNFVKWSFILFFMLCTVMAGLLIGAYFGIIENAPALPNITIPGNIHNSVVYDSNGNIIDYFKGEENREYITLDRIPLNLRNAIVAVEDSRFYEHDGIDYKGMTRAVWVTLKGFIDGSNRKEGASTITQQLIKNQFIKDGTIKTRRNNVITKIQEQYLAVKYEEKLIEQLGSKKSAKDYILELYLNTIGLHHAYEGVQAASKGYFNKNVEELNLAECACIAGITNNPTLYSPRTQPENNKKRTSKILKDMLAQGYITSAEYNEALADNIYERISDNDTASALTEEKSSTIHSYFVDSVFEQVSNDLQEQHKMSTAAANNLLYNGGLQILTTYDPEVQEVLDEYFIDVNNPVFPTTKYNYSVVYNISVEDSVTKKQTHSEFRQYIKTKDDAPTFTGQKRAEIEAKLSPTESVIGEKTTLTVQPQSAMVIMDYKTGQVKGIAGGRGEKIVNRGLNRAVDSKRQPGSVFKVLAAFAPGIDLGTLTPATVFDDKAYTYAGYSPQNWYKGYRGPSTVREGITNSMNIVAVKAMVETGIDRCYEYLLNFGFTTLENDNHAATALGGLTYGVTQLEVTAAYGTIANGGIYNKPTFYTKVLDNDGNVLLEYVPEQRQVLKKTSAYLVTDMMRDVITKGTGTACKFRNIKVPVSGKTGTTQHSRDLTFVGYTPYYVAGVWLGYDDYDNTVKNMEGMNQSIHLNLWRNVMEKIHSKKGFTTGDFEKPDGITDAWVCKDTKEKTTRLAGKSCPGYKEIFDVANVPTKYCGITHYSESSSDSSDNDVKTEETTSIDSSGTISQNNATSESESSQTNENITTTPSDEKPATNSQQPAVKQDNDINSSNDPLLGTAIPAVPDDVAQDIPQAPEANPPPADVTDNGPIIE